METRSINYPTRHHAPVRIYRDHKIVAQSRNLRGVLDYARRVKRPYYIAPVERAYVFPVGAGKYPSADVLIKFCDGSVSLTHFESYLVASHWIESRCSWNLRNISLLASIAVYAPR